MKDWLESVLSVNFVKVVMEKLGMVIYSHDEAQNRQLLALNGRLLSNGETIQVKKLEPHLSLSEMRQICHDTLQPKEHVQEMKAAGGGNRIPPRYPPRPSQVAALYDEENEASDGEPQSVAVVGQSGPPQQGRGQTTPKTPAHASMPVASGSSRPPQQNPGKGSRREPKRQNVQNAQDASQKSPVEIKNATPVPTNSVDINVNVRNDPPANAQTDMSRNFGSFQNDWQGKGKGGGQQSDNRWHGKGAFQYPPRNVEYGAFFSRQEQLGKGKGRGGKKGGNGDFLPCQAPYHAQHSYPGQKGGGKGFQGQSNPPMQHGGTAKPLIA